MEQWLLDKFTKLKTAAFKIGVKRPKDSETRFYFSNPVALQDLYPQIFLRILRGPFFPNYLYEVGCSLQITHVTEQRNTHEDPAILSNQKAKRYVKV